MSSPTLTVNPLVAEDISAGLYEEQHGDFTGMENASDRAVENLQAATLAVEHLFHQQSRSTAGTGVFPF